MATGASGDAFFRQVTLPIIGLVVLLVALVGAGLYWDVNRSNSALIDRQVRMAQMTVAASVDELAYQQQSEAMWQSLADMVRAPRLDAAWLDENTGGWLYRMFGHNWVVVLDAHDRPVYIAREGKRVSNAQFAAIRPALDALIDGARGRTQGGLGPHDRRAGGAISAGSTAMTNASAVHESDLALIAGRPAAASVMRIRVAPSTGGQATDTGFLLLDIRFLDGAYLQQLSRRNMIDGLHFSRTATVPEGERAFPLVNTKDQTVGYFHWRPELPGNVILEVMLPGAILGLALLIAALLFLERSLRGSNKRLRASFVEIEQRNHELEKERMIALRAEAEREAAVQREGRHLEREREDDAKRRIAALRRSDLLSVAERFERSVLGIAASVGAAAEQLAVSAVSLESLSAESNRQTHEAAERVHQVSKAAVAVAQEVGTLSRSIVQISERADQQTDLSTQALANTDSGAFAMKTLVCRASGISDFTDRIGAIASRTNLLSLNATIEAARAGDVGRGFSVVANEIKHLASQATGATNEIGALISAIHDSADVAGDALQDISSAVASFAVSAQAIHNSVSSQRAAAEGIEQNASQTAREAGSIALQIHRVAAVANEAGSLSGQVTGAAQNLLRDALLMRDATHDFLMTLRETSTSV